MTKAAYIAVMTGVAMMALLTVSPDHDTAHHGVHAVLWVCLAYFIYEWLVRLRQAVMTHRVWSYVSSVRGLVDAAGAVTVPLAMLFGADPKTAWLLSIVCSRSFRGSCAGALRQRAGAGIRSAAERAGDLPDGGFPGVGRRILFERDAARHFGSSAAALWVAVVTATTTGYGDVVRSRRSAGRRGARMICASAFGP
jgi:voltage-gated potassium channel